MKWRPERSTTGVSWKVIWAIYNFALNSDDQTKQSAYVYFMECFPVSRRLTDLNSQMSNITVNNEHNKASCVHGPYYKIVFMFGHFPPGEIMLKVMTCPSDNV